ncbi:MAG TPA: type I phosphomannose isomerase catalytic subunit [Gammaproteobacteria bacterium]|nr:type I phosphomannose isomerase catalytic subunit [Gammaproteobacteria bacterium]
MLQGDRGIAAELATRPLKPQRDNLVERPWGGDKLAPFKSLSVSGGRRFGESFEISADDADDEARLHPSVLELADGSTITLPALLAVHADALLGEAFVRRYGRRFPLLPKLLDVAELLSVQAHPPGNTEVYVIVDADRGATIRLGFAVDVDAAAWAAKLNDARRDQQRLLELLGADSADELQALLKDWLARREARPAELEKALIERLRDAKWADVETRLAKLHETYWAVLDSLNAVPVKAGDVVYNSNPPSVVAASGKPASAEVHALGNPEGRAVFALEIRHPGPTFRAWDNVRFPLRNLDIEGAFGAVNLSATRPQDFIVAPKRVRPGVSRSVDCEYFRLEHLEPTASRTIDVPASAPHCLHAIAGSVSVRRGEEEIGTVERGESAFVPAGVGAYRVVAEGGPASVVRVTLPPYVD